MISKYLQIHFTKFILDNFKFERIIFQRQIDGSMIIVLHCADISELMDIHADKLIYNLIMIFGKYPKFAIHIYLILQLWLML